MADLKDSHATSLTIGKAATEPTEPIRKSEFDATVATLATAAALQEVIGSSHPAVTVENSSSVTLTLNEQQLSAAIHLTAQSEIQAAGAPTVVTFGHPIIAGTTLDLGKLVTTVSTIERYSLDDELLATGVAGTDYEEDSAVGTVYIPVGSNLITSATQYLRVVYSCAAVNDGSGMLNDASNVRVNFGTEHDTVARGDHRHTNDHRAATGSSTNTATATVSQGQVVAVNVTLDPAGNLSSTVNGVRVTPNVFSATGHTHAAATTEAAGFMSAADKQRLDNLGSSTGGFSDSSTVSFESAGTTTANVKLSIGLTTDGSGVAVDFNTVAQSGHTHTAATSTTGGFMSASQVSSLAAVRYPYVAYADDIVGSSPNESPSGFSTTLSTTKQWMALRISDTPISNPQASDFSGLWYSITPYGA